MADDTAQTQEAPAAAPEPAAATEATTEPTPAAPVEQPAAEEVVAAAPVPVAPDPVREGAITNLQMHLQDIRSFLSGFEHEVEGDLGEIVTFLKAKL